MPKPSKSDNKRAQNEASSSSNEPQLAPPTPKKTRLVQSRLTFGGSSSLVGQHSFSVDQVASSSSHQDQPIKIQSTLLPSGASVVKTRVVQSSHQVQSSSTVQQQPVIDVTVDENVDPQTSAMLSNKSRTLPNKTSTPPNKTSTPQQQRNTSQRRNQKGSEALDLQRAKMLGHTGTIYIDKFLPDSPYGFQYPPKQDRLIEKASLEKMEQLYTYLLILKKFVGKLRAANITHLEKEVQEGGGPNTFFKSLSNRKKMCSLVNNAVNQQKDTFEKREKARKSTNTRRAKLVEEGKCSECGHVMDNVALTSADKEFLNDKDVLLVEGSSSASSSNSSSNSSTNILDYGDEMDAETLFDDNGFIRTTFLRPRCQQCLRKHNERERQKYHKVKEEGVMCPSHPSVPLEVCDPELGTTACLKCGLVHMGKQFASLKCCSTHSMGRPPQCLPACSLCGIVIENLYQAVAACIHHIKFQLASKTKRSFTCTKYFATAFRKEKDPNWFKTEEPLEILCKACHHLLHAVYLMEKQGPMEGEKVLEDFREWVQVHIKMVRLLGAKCAKCDLDFEKLGLAFFILAHVHHIKTDGADQRRSATHILELEDREHISQSVNEYTLALEGKQPLELYQCLCACCHQMVHMEKNARLVLSKEEHSEDREKVKEMFNLQSRFRLIPEIKRRLFGGRDDEK